jgi:hypothetical protein
MSRVLGGVQLLAARAAVAGLGVRELAPAFYQARLASPLLAPASLGLKGGGKPPHSQIRRTSGWRGNKRTLPD